jgi:hypothetical protein
MALQGAVGLNASRGGNLYEMGRLRVQRAGLSNRSSQIVERAGDLRESLLDGEEVFRDFTFGHGFLL